MATAAIRHIFYRPEREELSVWFAATGRRYKYFYVPAQLAEEFKAAPSRGRFYNDHIRGRYECLLVEEPSQPRHRALTS